MVRGVVETIGPSTELEHARAELVEIGRGRRTRQNAYLAARQAYTAARAEMAGYSNDWQTAAARFEALGGVIDPKVADEFETPLEVSELDRIAAGIESPDTR